jgi:hypothetical protein
MSYEPTLVILKKDLDKHKDLIIDGNWQYSISEDEQRGEEGLTVMEYIKNVYTRHSPIKVGGIELVLCTPCFSSFNAKVREKLKELKIEFAENN